MQYHYVAALPKHGSTQEAVIRLQALKESSFAEKKEAMALLKSL